MKLKQFFERYLPGFGDIVGDFFLSHNYGDISDGELLENLDAYFPEAFANMLSQLNDTSKNEGKNN
jgi:hypothetical protein